MCWGRDKSDVESAPFLPLFAHLNSPPLCLPTPPTTRANPPEKNQQLGLIPCDEPTCDYLYRLGQLDTMAWADATGIAQAALRKRKEAEAAARQARRQKRGSGAAPPPHDPLASPWTRAAEGEAQAEAPGVTQGK